MNRADALGELRLLVCASPFLPGENHLLEYHC